MKLKIFLFLSLIAFFSVFGHEKVAGNCASDNSVIYNIDQGNEIVVCEYEDYLNDEKYKKIGIYFVKEDTFQKILTNNGDDINNDVNFPSISRTGEYITFTSRATNITGEVLRYCYDIIDKSYNPCSNIYIYNIYEKKSTIIKYKDDYLNGDNYLSVISGDGKTVVFESSSYNSTEHNLPSNCFSKGINSCINIYKYDVGTKEISLVTKDSMNNMGNANSISPTISYDGEYISFQSSAKNLIGRGYDHSECKNVMENGESVCSHIFLFNSKKNQIKIVTTIGKQLFNDNSGNAKISGNGRYIAYESYSTNISIMTNNKLHIVLYDIDANVNTIISKNGKSLNNRDNYILDVSKDGLYVMYNSDSTNLNIYV